MCKCKDYVNKTVLTVNGAVLLPSMRLKVAEDGNAKLSRHYNGSETLAKNNKK